MARLVRHRLMLRSLHIIDYLFLALGFLSVFILAFTLRGGLQPEEAEVLRSVDLFTVAIFGIAFVGKFLTTERPFEFLRSHWFAIFGFLPITMAVLVPDRFYLIVQVLIVLSRFGQALDRAFGVRVGYAIYSRYKAAIVEELTEPILDRMFHLLQVNLREGRYAESVGRGIESSRGNIHAAVTRAMKASPNLQTVSKIPGVESLVHAVVDEALTAAVATLESDEINVAIQRSIDKTFEDLRVRVRDPQWKEVGVGFGDVGRALVKGSS